MIEREPFTEGLARIAIATQAKDITPAVYGVYWDAIGPQTEAEEWARFTRGAVASGRWSWFPKVREILDALREFRGEPPLEVQGVEAYERVLACSTYTAAGGASWHFRQISERCGRAAADAFLAAGGSQAFETTWDESKRRQRFVEAYAAAVREEPETALRLEGPKLRLIEGGK